MKSLDKPLLFVLFTLTFFGLTIFLSTNHAIASTPDRDNMHSPLLATAVSTHGNIGYAGRTEETFQYAPFMGTCIDCHSSHGSSNLATILSTIYVKRSPSTTTGPIVFTALTGTNSFDDGISAVTSRICVACHVNANRPGAATAMRHTGGAGHFSGDYTGQNCLPCHPHDPDGDPATIDGFMPSGGSCVGCHKQAQGTAPVRRQIVDSNGDGSGTGGDFKSVASHHVSGASIPADADCEVCHEQSQHMQGNVRLYNADNSATVYALDGSGDATDYEGFCLSCHDGSAARLATPNKPFSGTGLLSSLRTVSLSSWNTAGHNTSASVGSCINCHNNGHGTNKVNMLADNIGTATADDPNAQEESFCYECHDGSPAAVNVMAEFGLTSHHRIATTEQSAAGIQLECVSCHNPHTNNTTSKVSNPDNLSQLASNDNTFCLTCHDNLVSSPLPVGVSFGTYTVPGFTTGDAATVWDKSIYVNSAHYTGDVALPNIQCRHCHENHGASISGYQDLLKATYTRVEGQGQYPWNGGAGFNLCFGCHTADDGKTGLRDVANDAWAGEHASHDDDGPCIYCHDVHAAYDPGEFGLVSFEYNRFYSDLTYLVGYNASTAFDRTRNPPCGIACHGVGHSTKKYTAPPNYDTTPGYVFPFGFSQPAAATYIVETTTDPLFGTVSNPDITLQNGLFNGNGVDTYISFTSNPDTSLASDTLVIETSVMPQGIPTSTAFSPSSKYAASLFNSAYVNSTYWILSPQELFNLAAPVRVKNNNYEAVIFDRGADANYRVSILRNNGWDTYEAPPGVASFAFWVNPINKHGGQDWKVVVTNYKSCPIVSDHWYSLSIQWDSNRPTKSPADIFVDDRGTAGDNSDEMWQGAKNCTDLHPTKSLVPDTFQTWAKDRINSASSDFTIGASVGAFSNVFQGLIESIIIYPEDAARDALLNWQFYHPNNQSSK